MARELRIEKVNKDLIDKVKIKAIRDKMTLREAVIKSLEMYVQLDKSKNIV